VKMLHGALKQLRLILPFRRLIVGFTILLQG
jgi:hypothetical protein